MTHEAALAALPFSAALGIFIESPVPGGKLARIKLRDPELELPPGFCFATDGEERVKKGDEEIIPIPRERFGDNEPLITEDQVDLIFRAA